MSEQAYTPRKCTKHVPYWETVYGNCMACRAEKAEQQLQAIQATVGETEFALRARVAELEKERDAALAEQAVLDAKYVDERAAKDAAYADVDQYYKCLQIEKREHAVSLTERDALRTRLGVAEQQIETYKKQFSILNGSVHIHYEEKLAAQARVEELEAKLKRLQVFVDTSQWQKDNESLKQQLATANADLRLALLDELNKKKG